MRQGGADELVGLAADRCRVARRELDAARVPRGETSRREPQRTRRVSARLCDHGATITRRRPGPAPSKDRGRVRSVVGVVADRSDSGVPAGDRPAGRCRGCRPRLPLRRAPGSTRGAARGVAGQTVHYRTAPRSSTRRRYRPDPHSYLKRRGSHAGSASFSGLELLAVPPQHTGVNVDDEPPARRVARVAADRPRVGHADAGREPVVRLARNGPHRARSGAVVGE